MRRLILVILVFSGSLSPVFSQSGIEPSKLRQFNITVNFEDYTVKTQMLSQNKNICVNTERTYMWYSAQKIIETRGGYDGKLLHGTYRAFYLNNQLKEQGQIKYGLRHREWKYWYSDGKLKEVIHWKNGVKNGAYYLYNDYGQLMAKSHFRNDKLHGRFYTYNSAGKIVEMKRYKRGDEVVPKVKTKREETVGRGPKEKKKKKENAAGEKEKTVKKKRILFKGWFKRKKSESKTGSGKTLKTKSVTS